MLSLALSLAAVAALSLPDPRNQTLVLRVYRECARAYRERLRSLESREWGCH